MRRRTFSILPVPSRELSLDVVGDSFRVTVTDVVFPRSTVNTVTPPVVGVGARLRRDESPVIPP